MRPHELPRARGRLVAAMDGGVRLIRLTADGNDLRQVRASPEMLESLRTGSLYWTAPDMAALAVHAGATLDDWATTQPPAPAGLMVWDGGIGQIHYGGKQIPISGCVWGPFGSGLGVSLWISSDLALSKLGNQSARKPPLLPFAAWELPKAVGGDCPETVLRAITATWTLMQQPTLVDHSVQRPDRALRRQAARASLGDPTLTIVDLRKQYRPDEREEIGEESGRRYRHRWVVSGHWRDQPYGPGRALRRRQWIEEYMKGPDGAPLLVTERVNVWRR